jgi:hypothetical protein
MHFAKYVVCLIVLLCSVMPGVVYAQLAPPEPVKEGRQEADVIHDHWVYGSNGGSNNNILWAKRVWREVDVAQAVNKVLVEESQIKDAYSFAAVLAIGMKAGAISTYFPDDDSFVYAVPVDKVIEILQPLSAAGRGDAAMNFVMDSVKFRITGFRIMEDWLFLRDKGEMVVKIRGIAPEAIVTDAAGIDKEIRLFRINYDQCKDYLARFAVPVAVGGKGLTPGATWVEYFEARIFASRITKVGEPMKDGTLESEEPEPRHKRRKRK